MPVPLLFQKGPAKPEHFTEAWSRYHLRWQERNDRMDTMFRIVQGEWTVLAPDDDELISRSPNLIQVALKDTAESSNMQPTVRVMPSSVETDAKDAASMMERLGTSYLDRSEFPILGIKSFLDLYAYGLFTWVVTWDEHCGPKIEWRDPRTAFPEPDFSSLAVANRCFFARELYVTQLPQAWQDLVEHHRIDQGLRSGAFDDTKISIVEYYDDKRIIVGMTYNASQISGTSYFLKAEPTLVTVILEDCEHPLGVCPVIIGQQPDLDPEPRGQFDQVVNILLTHIQLMALVVDNADDTIYADVWVRDLIGPMSHGGKSYIQLGPQGAIGRLAPASPSFSLFNELQQLIDAFHIGARWPKQRTGETDQSQASGKLIETAVAVMNQVIRTGHTIMKQSLTQALRVLYRADKLLGPKRTVAGVYKNQQFLMERDRADIDLQAIPTVDYGLGFGRDPSTSAVLHIQYMQTGVVSLETVQENVEGITDVGLEKQRLLLQQFRDMALAQILQGLQEKSLPPKTLVELAKAIQDGEDVFEVYNKYVVKPTEEQMAQQYPSGLTGEMMSPGGAPPALGPGSPQAPPPEELLAAIGAGGGGEPETIGRLSAPLPGGGFMGSQSTGGGG